MLFDFNESPVEYIDKLVEKYSYKPLPTNVSVLAREFYAKTLPDWCNINGDKKPLFTLSGTKIANGFSRVVIGDYGAFIEINKSDMVRESICCASGEEYRFRDPSFKDKVKYYHYTAKDESNAKIYFQQRGVSYADYKPDMFYISPFEVII